MTPDPPRDTSLSRSGAGARDTGPSAGLGRNDSSSAVIDTRCAPFHDGRRLLVLGGWVPLSLVRGPSFMIRGSSLLLLLAPLLCALPLSSQSSKVNVDGESRASVNLG